jgi:D-alanine-D-alanine ligase
VARSLDPGRYEVVPIGITPEGRWMLPQAGLEALETGEMRGDPVIPGADRQLLRRQSDSGGAIEPARTTDRIDVVFPVLHGPFGEDGTIQGLLELAGVPYVGAGVLGSSLGMDKIAQKTILEANGIPVVSFGMVRRCDWREDPETTIEELELEFDYPVFVKPANLGSSVGITKAHDQEELRAALDQAGQFDLRILIEQGLEGVREVECAVIGNEDPEVSVVGEIRPTHEFYDYEAKYLDENGAELVIPADLPESLTQQVQELAKETYLLLDCAGMARVDFFVREEPEQVWVNEINTIPGFTQISMFPRLWEASGLPPDRLVERLVHLAIERHSERRALRTQR